MARHFSQQHTTRITIVFSDKTRSHTQRTLCSRLCSFIRHTVDEYRVARQLQLPLSIVEDVNSPQFAGRILPSDHGIVAGFNQIFREETIRRFKSLVNFHPSILPLYRGPVPSYWCIVNGEDTTGFTLHQITRRIDEGEILAQEIVPIGSMDDPDVLDQKIAEAAMEVFRAYLQHLHTGEPMTSSRLDAKTIYKTHISYRSFPK